MKSEKILEAIRFSFEVHSNQYRKGTQIPYISHPLAVASLVLDNGGTETEFIAALLHDAVEDGNGEITAKEIKEKFSDEVENIVKDCSDTDIKPKPPWRERKMLHIKHASIASDSAKLVMAADKLHNIRSIISDYKIHGEDLWQRFNAPKEDILWYYRSMINALICGKTKLILRELRRLINELEVEVASTGPSMNNTEQRAEYYR